MPDQGAVPIRERVEMSLRQRTKSEIVVVVIPSCRTGLRRQKPFSLTTRMLIVNSEAISRVPERERITFEP